jgi:exodeoxyribonuclease V beta subunit
MSDLPEPFDLLGPLPVGTTVLEASAGTGKTYTIAALVARYVAEGAAELGELLVVTFGRAATRELRERVRERLAEARGALADPVAVAAALSGPDPLLRHLAAGSPAEVEARHGRLARAGSSFDAATVATTHQFAGQVLAGLGTAADVDPDSVLVEDMDALVVEVAGDLYLRKYATDGAPPPDFTPAEAVELARAAVGDRQALLSPAPVGDDGPAMRARFATAVRTQVELRRRNLGILGFDDLLTRLQQTLSDPTEGAAARARLRGRYRVVLVDEFQDTDPVQWSILLEAFDGHATLVLIGDPKQAIYAFRGGDVHAYLEAAAVAGAKATLPTNWRSDEVLLRGLDALFAGAALGDPRIVVVPVTAGHPAPALRRPGPTPPTPVAPVRLRITPSAGLPVNSRSGLPLVAAPRAAVADDLAAEIVALLTDGSALLPPVGGVERPVHPGDMAVLVRTNAQAELVRDRLVAAGVPSVLRATASVFATAAATDWLVLLEALEQPHRTGRVRRLAVSGFVGRDAAELAAAGADGDDELGLLLRTWAAVLAERGVAALLAAVDGACGTLPRLLAQPGGERHATDLRHIGDLLHGASMASGLGLAALLTWLRRRLAEAGGDSGAERSRRLDSDARAVQIVTIHTSKGLEFPLVFVPFAWDRHVWEPGTPLYHDAASRRVRDVGGPGGAGWRAAVTAHQVEEAGEDLRLLYVAATRARSALTLWWARSSTTATSPLHRLLFGAVAGEVPPREVPVPGDADALAALAGRAAGSGGGLAVEAVSPRAPARWTPPAGAVPALAAAAFDRPVDTAWRRTSYSGLTAAAHEAGPAVGSEPEEPGTVDEPEAPAADGRAAAAAAHALPSPFAGLGGGAAFGTLVHAVLEVVDAASATLRADLAAAVAAQAGSGVTGADPEALAAALHTAMTTPLGPLAGGRPLTGFAAADRLVELDFELPLAGGERPGRDVRLGELGPLLTAHLPVGDPVRAYAGRLAGPELATGSLRGYLTGSIDAVLRVPADGPAGAPRYLVVDYKTNRLTAPDVEATAWHYRPAALAPAMRDADYPLQALLYTVALHRYLTWRQPGYDPALHLGGVLYLYLRGMCGEEAAPEDADGDGVPGVFAWRPPAALVVATSALLAGRNAP